MEHNADSAEFILETKWSEFIKTPEGSTFNAVTTMPRTEYEKKEAVSWAFDNNEHAADRLEFLLAHFAPQENLSFAPFNTTKGLESAFAVMANWLKSDQCHVTSMDILSEFDVDDQLANYLDMLSEAKTLKSLKMLVWDSRRPADEHAKIFKNSNRHVALHLDTLEISGAINARFLPLLKDMLKPPQYINHLEFKVALGADVDRVAFDEYIREVQASIPTKSTKAARRPD